MLLRRSRVAAVLVVAAVAAVVPASISSAHVRVVPGEVEQGSFEKLTFRVPTERDVPTVKVEIVMPTDAPFAFLNVQPTPGWTYEETKRTLDTPVEAFGQEVSEVVDRITWSGGAIQPGEFQEFSISAGPMPAVDTMEFKAIQTYEGGEVVRWIEPIPASGEEPEAPAPTVKLVPAASDTAASTTASTAAAVQTGAGAQSDDDGSGTGLAVVALVVAVVALLVAGFVAIRPRR